MVINKVDRAAARPDEVALADPGSLPRPGHRRRAARLSRSSTPSPATAAPAARPTPSRRTCARCSTRSSTRSRPRPSTPTPRSSCWSPRSTTTRTAAGSRSAGSSAARIRAGEHAGPDRAGRRADPAAGHLPDHLRRASAGARSRRPAPATSSPSPGSPRPRSARRWPTRPRPEALAAIAIEEPTLKLTFGVNTSPFAGRDGQVLDLAPAPRAALPRAGDEPLAARRADRAGGRLRRLRPRRAAPLDPDRDDAPRGLRVPGLAARGDHQGGRRADAGAGRAPGDRHDRAVRRRRHRAGRRAQGADAGHGQRRPGQRAPRVRDPDPRPDRAAQRLPDRDQGQRRDGLAPARLRAVDGPDRLDADRRAGRVGNRRRPGARDRQRPGARDHLHRAGRPRSTRA